MGLVIDTNIFIDAENGRLELDSLDFLTEYDDAYIAAITVSELLTGVHIARTADLRVRRTAFVEGIIANITVLEFNEKVARSYAELYTHYLKPRSKVTTNVHDLQIAATAIAHGFPVLTSNITDFKKVPGLKTLKPTR